MDDGRYLSGMSASVLIDEKVWELEDWASFNHTDVLDVTDSESERLAGPEELVWVCRENIDDLTTRVIRLKGAFSAGAMPLVTGKAYDFVLQADTGVEYQNRARVADIRRLSGEGPLQRVQIDAISTGPFRPEIA